MRLGGPNSKWRDVTPYLLYCAFCFAWGDILFGIDTGSFGAIQSLPVFLREFGEERPPNSGKFVLPTARKSLMNSIVWPGKLAGTLAFEPVVERCGFKRTMYICCVVQAIAIIIQATSHEWVQFSVGRIIAYFGVGLIENVVPAYQAEIAPASMRGLIAGSLMCLVTLGAMWGTGMGKAMANYTTNAGWIIPVTVQLIPAVIFAVGVPFTVESPRWLVLHGKKDKALKNLNRLRPKKMVETGMTAAEINAIDFAIESNQAADQGRWLDLFRGTYLRRTVVASLLFWFHQTTGQQFVNSYGPTFFKLQGLGADAFTYSFVAQAAGVAGPLISMFLVDRVGRRPLLISGLFLAVLFNFLVAGLGRLVDPSTGEVNTVIASIILLNFSCKYSINMMAYLITAEIGGVKMRKKIIGFATSIDVLSAFVITFCIPYLIGTPGAALGANVGWILGGDSVLGLLFAIFFVPELAGRSLEEVDELFDAKLWAWQFKDYKTSGVGHRITMLEDHTATEGGPNEKVAISEVEETHVEKVGVAGA